MFLGHKVKTAKKIRLNLDLTATVKDQLDKLQIRTEASSLTEVIRRALAVYDLMIEQEEMNGKIFLEDKNGERERLRIIV